MSQEHSTFLYHHTPRRSGALMTGGVLALVLAQVIFGFGIVEAVTGGSYYSAPNPAPYFVVGILIALIGLVLVLLAYSRLAENVEYLAIAEHERRHASK